MSAPEPMLSTAIRSWPPGGDWMLEPKFDGFRAGGLHYVASDLLSRGGADLWGEASWGRAAPGAHAQRRGW